MREIKFRAWVKTKKAGHEMFTVVMISWIGKEVVLSGKGGSISLDDCELMQYTGLKDKNGKEIYEGDIFLNPPEPWGDEEIVEVYFDEKDLFWKGRSLQSDDELVSFSTDKVIGNIYENPELLKEK